MRKIWHDDAWDDYLYWQTQDKKTLKKINKLLKDIDRNGYKCTGKPEALSGNLAGFWSVRIDDKNRIVFRIANDCIEIAVCVMDTEDIRVFLMQYREERQICKTKSVNRR